MSQRKIKTENKPEKPKQKNALDKLHRNGILTGYALAIKDLELYITSEAFEGETRIVVERMLTPLITHMRTKLKATK